MESADVFRVWSKGDQGLPCSWNRYTPPVFQNPTVLRLSWLHICLFRFCFFCPSTWEGTTTPVLQQGKISIRKIYVKRQVLNPGLNDILVCLGTWYHLPRKKKVRLEVDVSSLYCQQPRRQYNWIRCSSWLSGKSPIWSTLIGSRRIVCKKQISLREHKVKRAMHVGILSYCLPTLQT